MNMATAMLMLSKNVLQTVELSLVKMIYIFFKLFLIIKTRDEVASMFNPLLQNPLNGSITVNHNDLSRSRRALPATVDYRNQLPPVKMQGGCGSCWAFASSVTLEHQYAKSTKKVVSLSEEQVAGCTYSRNGCSGGNGEEGNQL